MPKVWIGISSQGYAAGKTTLATYLALRLDGNVFNFATPIKLAVASILSQFPPYEYSYDPTSDEVVIHTNGQEVNKQDLIPELGVTLRHLYQTLGTEWGRNLVNDSMWIRIAKSRFGDSPVVIVPDYRFPNENIFDVTIRLIGRGNVDAHASECQHLPTANFVYTNNQSLQELYRFGDQIVGYIKERQRC